MNRAKNVGTLDAALRALLGIALVLVGGFVLHGFKGRIIGILVVLVSILPFTMAATRRCFVFRWFGLNSISVSKRKDSA